MAFRTPRQDQVKTEQVLPDPHHYDTTITDIRAQRAGSGNPMMIVEFTIDNGEFAGFSADEVFVFFDYKGPDEQHPTWQALKQIADCAGFEWEPAQSVESFAAQWPLNQLRVRCDLVHDYSVEAFWKGDNKYNVESISEELDDEHTEGIEWVNVTPRMYDDYGGKKNKSLAIRDGFDVENIYQPCEAKRELTFSEEDDFSQSEIPQSEAGGDGQTEGDPVPAGPAENVDDPLPF